MGRHGDKEIIMGLLNKHRSVPMRRDRNVAATLCVALCEAISKHATLIGLYAGRRPSRLHSVALRRNDMRWVAVMLTLFFTGTAIVLAGDSYPKIWDSWTAAVKLSEQTGTFEQALQQCKIVMKDADDPVMFGRAAMLAADLFIKMDKCRDAHNTLEQIYHSKREFPITMINEALLRDAKLYLQEQNIEAATTLLKRIISNLEDPFNPVEARVILAWCAVQKNDWAMCDSLTLQAVEANSVYQTDERVLTMQAMAALVRHDADRAINLLDGATSVNALQTLAQAYDQQDNQMMAVSIYKKLHDLYPNTPAAENALFQAAEVFMRAGDWLAARSEYNRLLQYFPQTRYAAVVHFRLGWAYLNLMQYNDALAEFRFPVSPQHAGAFQYMEGECLARMGQIDPDKAQQAIHKFHTLAAINLRSPLAPVAKMKAGLAELAKGDTIAAMNSLRQFLALFPKDDLMPAANFMLAMQENASTRAYFLKAIVQAQSNDDIFHAALFELLKQDFETGNYQKIIHSSNMIAASDSADHRSVWQRGVQLMLADAAYFLKHYDVAMQAYERAQSNTPDDISEKAQIGQAWCALQTQAIDSAIVRFETVNYRVSGASKLLARYGLATALYHAQRYEEAIRQYPIDVDSEGVAGNQPLIEKSMFRVAESLYRLQYYNQAIEYWEKLVAQYPESEYAPEAKFKAADTYFQANYFAEADSAFGYILEHYPTNTLAAESSLRMAQGAYNAGHYEIAIERYNSYLTMFPTHDGNKDALEGMQLCYFQLGQTDAASEALAKVVEQAANSDLAADARFRIAGQLFTDGQYAESVVAFKEIVTLYPNTSYAMDAQFSLAKAQMAQEQYDAANQELRRFIQYFPNSTLVPEAYYLLGIGYFNQESYLSALDQFTTLERQYPKSEFLASAMQNIGMCYDRLNQKSKAIEYLQGFLQQYPDVANRNQVQLQLATLMSEIDQVQSAITMCQELMTCKETAIAVEAAFRLGNMNMSLNKYQEAIRAFQWAIKNGSADDYYRLSAIAQLASIYENAGDHEKAIKSYEMLANSTADECWISAARERLQVLKR
ncbi:tetratricopeptide repeat protein [candidate division KSB1 bacterium]|nr:tetratricopeptide repeat protein [candidate division KSB1 bacterium]